MGCRGTGTTPRASTTPRAQVHGSADVVTSSGRRDESEQPLRVVREDDVASMYVRNLVLLVLDLPMVGLFVNLLRIPYAYLAPAILLVCVIGVYSVNASAFDIYRKGVVDEPA
jgi:hypothetical protein